MVKLIHSGDAYRYLDELGRRFESWAKGSCQSEFGYSKEVVTQRLVQRFTELMFDPFMADCFERDARGEYPLPDPDRRLVYDGAAVDQGDGSLHMGVGFFCRSLGHFFLHWFHVLMYILPFPVNSGNRSVTSATLLFGVGCESIFDLERGDDSRFAHFCRNFTIEPLRQAGTLVVQSATGLEKECKTSFIYSRFPLHWLLRQTGLGIPGRISLLVAHLGIIFRFGAAVLRNPRLVILARDVAYLPMVRALDAHRKIESVLVTNSTHSSQPLWMRDPASRGFRVHMIWYAQNIIPLVFKGDTEASHFPTYRHLCIDEHWLWTRALANYLDEQGVSGEKHVLGPILWYLPQADNRLDSISSTSINIAVFDVTPANTERSERIGLLRNYYNPDVAISFIEDIVRVAKQLEQECGKTVEVLIKSKRGYNFRHSSRYVDVVNKLADEGSLRIISHQTNLFTLMELCDLAIVIPNSSPALVAAHVGKKAIYYDPSSTLVANHEVGPNLLNASGQSGLQEAVFSVVNND